MPELAVMPMHDGSPMSMVWTGSATASFVAMWTGMMAAMMLPSLAPTLWRYHRAVDGMAVPRTPLRHGDTASASVFTAA